MSHFNSFYKAFLTERVKFARFFNSVLAQFNSFYAVRNAEITNFQAVG